MCIQIMGVANMTADYTCHEICNMSYFLLCNYKVLKMGQNSHTNMEGFRRASHIYPSST